MNRGRWVSAGLVVVLLAGTTGCETVKRKFTRKPKTTQGPEPIFTLDEEYRPEFPPDVRYQAHFAYWKAAHDDLLEGLGQATRLRRERATRQAIKELRAMQALLQGPPADGLGRFIAEMERLAQRLDDPVLDAPRLSVMRSSIESLYRRIDSGYDFHRVKAHLKSEAPAPPAAVEPPKAADAASAH